MTKAMEVNTETRGEPQTGSPGTGVIRAATTSGFDLTNCVKCDETVSLDPLCPPVNDDGTIEFFAVCCEVEYSLKLDTGETVTADQVLEANKAWDEARAAEDSLLLGGCCFKCGGFTQPERFDLKTKMCESCLPDPAHRCAGCGMNWVDSDNGFDTCSDCLARI